MTNPERDDALIAEKKRLADILEALMRLGTVEPWYDDLLRAAALLRGDEPAKPDRYVVAAREFLAAWYGAREIELDDWKDSHGIQAAAAVLRRHFEPPSGVVAAAKKVRGVVPGSYGVVPGSNIAIMRDFILKGDV